MGKKRVQVCISVDIDAVAGWLGSYGGEDSTSDISRGLFAGTVGVRRMLKLFDKYNIKTTFFIPGHSLETFPEECRMIAEKGHEIGLHGYSHENPVAMNLEQQTAIMDKVGYGLIHTSRGALLTRSVVLQIDQGLPGRQTTTGYGRTVVGVEPRRRRAHVEVWA